MDLQKLQNFPDYFGNQSYTLNKEEIALLTHSLRLLKHENHFEKVLFWGKIFGNQRDYYVSFGWTNDIFARTFYYTTNCCEWVLLPTEPGVNEGEGDANLLKNHFFDGYPSRRMDDINLQVPGLPVQAQQRPAKFKEEDILAKLVRLITHDTFIVPRNAVIRHLNAIAYDSGTGYTNDLHNYVFFLARNDIRDANADRANWMTRVNDHDIRCVSLQWPGVCFYHVRNTNDHAWVYVGHGNTNDTKSMQN